jgi:hypothetical protein
MLQRASPAVSAGLLEASKEGLASVGGQGGALRRPAQQDRALRRVEDEVALVAVREVRLGLGSGLGRDSISSGDRKSTRSVDLVGASSSASSGTGTIRFWSRRRSIEAL